MPLPWVVLWSALPLLVLPSGPDGCRFPESSSSANESPLLESLSCHNDFESFVHCKWRRHGDTSPQLWFQTEDSRELCVPYSPPGPDEPGTVQCRYKTRVFSIGIKHTVFFLENQTQAVCSSVPRKPLDLSLHVRARPPEDLSAHDPGDGGRWLSWSSPYSSSSSSSSSSPSSPSSSSSSPSSSSSSSWGRNLSYQLSYRPEQHDHWTTEDVTNTSVKLERQLLLPGRRYESRVRARASVGQWSSWSPVVTWKTEEDTGQLPSLHCELHGEKEVLCSWEVSRELAPFISYQLLCRHRHTAESESCCVNPTVSWEGTAVRYSCSLTSTDPAHLLLELLPTHTARRFEAYQHIRPNPPWQLRVKEKENKWMVEWTEPSTASKLRLFYQVCYHRADQECSTPLNLSEGSTSLSIRGASLVPSQLHQVKVRSLVFPGHGSRYQGIPSEWTDPVDWTSHAGAWSLTTLIYVLICLLAVTVFFALYCTIPACQRRVVLWVDSVPSPHKSNILCEIKCVTSWTLQTEDTSICKVLLDNASDCSSSHASLGPITTVDEKLLEADEGFWTSDDLSSPAEKMSFSGPYIFCKRSEPDHKSEEDECLEKEDRTSSEDSPPPVKFTQNADGYVSLPNRGVSRSTQDLVSNSVVNTNTHRQDSVEQDPQRAGATPGSEKPDLSEAPSREPPPAYTPGPFAPWPQGGSLQASGYCHLPQHT